MPSEPGTVSFAAVQMSSQADVAHNLERARSLCRLAVARGAQVVVLPENFAFFGDEADKAEVAETLGAGPISSALAELAQTCGVFVVGGGMPERTDDRARPHNACVVFSPEGELAAVYRKIHLFDVDLSDGATYRESRHTTPGQEPCVVDLGGVTTGLSVCYDLRFPELYRRLADLGAACAVVPAAFTLLTGKDHWHVLLRARAIESQMYVVAAAQWGKHPGDRRTFGKSCIVDPWGEIIAQASEGEGLAVAPVELDRVASVREKLPALRHRRL
jgi:predicted amidohydrolase